MNEFIVWDNEDSKFISWEEVSFTKNKGDDFIIVMKEIDPICSEGRIFKSFEYIGLNDINNNKIYADSSIVEFTVTLNDGYYCGRYMLNGVFKYDKELLCYILECINFDKIFIYAMSFKNIENIKIIDTIQENKLGLMD